MVKAFVITNNVVLQYYETYACASVDEHKCSSKSPSREAASMGIVTVELVRDSFPFRNWAPCKVKSF